jgi:hypothetical protein
MRGRDRQGPWPAVVLLTAGLGLSGCTAGGVALQEQPPANVAAIPGKDVKSVTLSDRAAKRIGVQTVQIAASPQGPTVPYSAVFYAADGVAWLYTVTQPLTYVREQVTVANVGGAAGDQAFLSSGPAAGTTVVKAGVIELYGTEIGISTE